MSNVQRGTLKLTKKGKFQVLFNGTAYSPVQAEYSRELKLSDGLEVEFDFVRGQPKEIHAVGQRFVPQSTQATTTQGKGQQQSQKHGGKSSSKSQAQSSSQLSHQAPRSRDFHNPYNFIPAPPRCRNHSDLADSPPTAHDIFDCQRYTGRISVSMVVETPVLVPDAAKVEEDNEGRHKTFPLRVDANGLPSIPASSIRGMLRSAFEAVTNSRFCRFSADHKNKLMHRETKKPFRKVEYEASAWNLLDKSLRPATSIGDLSPADRVFGWVRADGDGPSDRQSNDRRVAARGSLRIGPVTCLSDITDAVESFAPPGVPLAILAAPKPQQGRFYVAASPNGEAQSDGCSKAEAGYSPGKGLRGRKVYPHHKHLPADHWNNPTEDRTQNGVGELAPRQEYRRPKANKQEQRDDQNRSILGWVKPGAQFAFDVQVQNLSQVELGALFWLLKLPPDHFFRLGGGKPLGFGSVHLSIDECDVRTGDDLITRYSTWNTPPAAADPTDRAIQAFQQAVVETYPPTAPDGGFEEVSFIKAFLVACRGYQTAPGNSTSLPIHYPRATANGQPGPPSPDGESFKWFVANEQKGARYALPDLAGDVGLPTLKAKS